MESEISLQDLIGEGGFEACLISTYSIYPPFLEEFVLPRLRSNGCRYNIVLADAKECYAALASSESRPRHAGRDYVLFPVRSSGAFHPKIIILAGRSKCVVAIGSHNLTLSGFGYNRELTTLFRFKPSEGGLGPQVARQAWAAVKQWIGKQNHVPQELQRAVSGFLNYANWLEAGAAAIATPAQQFVAQTSQGKSLWSQVQETVSKQVRRIVVLGPFFDKRLALLAEIRRTFPEVPLYIGIDPETVEISGSAAESKLTEFRDASTLYRETGYLHAKALYFDAGGPQDVLIVGSANPSAPAWLGEHGDGNEEAVVVHRGASARDAAKDLGLAGIPALPKLSRKSWELISAQRTKAAQPAQSARVLIATVVEGGLAIPTVAFGDAKPVLGVVRSLHGEELFRSGEFSIDAETVFFPLSVSICRLASLLTIQVSSGADFFAIVHHTEEIRDLARSSKQAQLRQALAGLGGNSEDLAKLISTIEKVIFDEPPIATVKRSGSGSESKEKSSTKGPKRPESLATTIDARKVQHHARILESGDLAYLLDVLLRQLGIGLERQEADIDDKGRSEEEQVNQDDEEDKQKKKQKQKFDDVALAKLCRGKVSRVVGRLGRQMGQTAKDKSNSPTILLQLVAVLALLRELRAIEKSPRWAQIHESLVAREDLAALLDHVLKFLFGRGYQLYKAITDSLDDERFDELARMKGLLIWLAWEAGVRLDNRFTIAEEPEDVGERLHDKAALLEFASMLHGDPTAKAEAAASILRVARRGAATAGSAWLAQYSHWADRIEGLLGHDVPKSSPKDVLRPGDIAVVTTSLPLKLRVVAEVSADQVSLVDFGPESWTVAFLPDRVVRVSA